MWWAPNVRWSGVADGRGQSWLILGKFKIQINPINLTFPGGENLWCNHICSTLAKVFVFLLSTRFLRRLWIMTFEFRDKISTSQFELRSRYSYPLRNWYWWKLQSVCYQTGFLKAPFFSSIRNIKLQIQKHEEKNKWQYRSFSCAVQCAWQSWLKCEVGS